MTIEAAFLDLMPSSVTVSPVATTDAYGKSTFGTGVVTRCRVQETGRVVKNADNEDVYEVGTIIFYDIKHCNILVLIPSTSNIFLQSCSCLVP